MSETGIDLQLLLSGVGANDTAVRAYLKKAVLGHKRTVINLPDPPMRKSDSDDPNSIKHGGQINTALVHDAAVPLSHTYRHFLLRQPRFNITVEHRFTGHHLVSGQLEGIASFEHTDFQVLS